MSKVFNKETEFGRKLLGKSREEVEEKFKCDLATYAKKNDLEAEEVALIFDTITDGVDEMFNKVDVGDWAANPRRALKMFLSEFDPIPPWTVDKVALGCVDYAREEAIDTGGGSYENFIESQCDNPVDGFRAVWELCPDFKYGEDMDMSYMPPNPYGDNPPPAPFEHMEFALVTDDDLVVLVDYDKHEVVCLDLPDDEEE